MTRRLLDTDILSYYFNTFSYFSVSAITVFEVLSGYKKIKSKPKEDMFLTFCRENEVIPLSQMEVEKAAEIQAELNKTGTPLSIPDIFIASSAIVNDFILVTNNEVHFSRISELQWENWVRQDINLS